MNADKDPAALPNPKKGILKRGSSRLSEEEERGTTALGHACTKKEFHFDEENIQETYHPANKDYGHMKIDEPNTPYHYLSEDDKTNVGPSFHAESLTARLEEDRDVLPRAMQMQTQDSASEDERTEEEKAKHEAFKNKRRQHYNEFLAVKMMRQRMAEEDDEDEDDAGQPSS